MRAHVPIMGKWLVSHQTVEHSVLTAGTSKLTSNLIFKAGHLRMSIDIKDLREHKKNPTPSPTQ